MKAELGEWPRRALATTFATGGTAAASSTRIDFPLLLAQNVLDEDHESLWMPEDTSGEVELNGIPPGNRRFYFSLSQERFEAGPRLAYSWLRSWKPHLPPLWAWLPWPPPLQTPPWGLQPLPRLLEV